MPQVPHTVAKERARRLRNKGAAAFARHLDGEVGQRRRVLMESNDIGRTEQFTPVQVAAAMGAMADVTISGHDGRQLLATSPARSV
jgi:threonylcarbamoyladenosine tRNA methylthiotransferase MtaB